MKPSPNAIGMRRWQTLTIKQAGANDPINTLFLQKVIAVRSVGEFGVVVTLRERLSCARQPLPLLSTRPHFVNVKKLGRPGKGESGKL
jgi:hypothetical protein